ncbi:hypothetical protein ACTJIJ_15005 [Niabella sp. 22666]|uniref:hypothetical protein n=1 Tax=Niabella sp. 22666 TaxID=3453954 RepID=UPI003F831E48
MMILLALCGCKEPEKHELTFYSEAFNWTLTLPDHFKQVPEARWQKKQQRESSLADQTFYRQTHEDSHYIGVFAQNATNYLEASYKILNSQYYTSYSTEFEDAC